MSIPVTIEHYIEIIKHHEKYRISTDARNKFWKELIEELKKSKG
jgi:hypothetical protein|tara:strand:- start:2566 stop:2697 length:132 start_codon:yes stop_codon:yes gene_type:complete